MKSPMAPSHLTLSDLERLQPMIYSFESFISAKGAELGHVLALNINRKPYMGSPKVPSHLTSE